MTRSADEQSQLSPEDAVPNAPAKLPAAPDDPADREHSPEQLGRISARAHLKSQHRTGSGAGDADKDWLEAEREIDSAMKGDRR